MRAVTTLEEVKSLPEETVLLETPHSNTMVCQKHDGEWYWTSDAASPGGDEHVELPALVVYIPEESPNA